MSYKYHCNEKYYYFKKSLGEKILLKSIVDITGSAKMDQALSFIDLISRYK